MYYNIIPYRAMHQVFEVCKTQNKLRLRLNKIKFIKLNPIIEPPPPHSMVWFERIFTTSGTDCGDQPTLKHV